MIKLTAGNIMTGVEAPDAIAQHIYDALSYKVKGAEFAMRYASRKYGRHCEWDSVKSFYNEKHHYFLTGLLGRVTTSLKEKGIPYTLIDARQKPAPSPLANGIELRGIKHRDYQLRVIGDFPAATRGVAKLATGAGKCLGKDTPVMMHNGTIKKVQDIVVGDFIMGDDSTPRKILSICSGVEELFRITPTKGMPYIVNRSHILSLKTTGLTHSELGLKTGKKIDVSVNEYLKFNNRKKHILKGYRVPVDFAGSKVNIDPYFLGLWLGDGRSNAATICTADKEIVNYINDYAAKLGMGVKTYPEKSAANSYAITNGRIGGKPSNILNMLRSYNLINNKHIPQCYIANSREIRLNLLAGIIDTDGYLNNNYFDINFVSKRLATDTEKIAQTLGFGTSNKPRLINNSIYYRVTIFGANLDQIPTRLNRKRAVPRLQKKDALVVGIKIHPIGLGKYYGFEIDGNKRFLLGDCTVTHNTEIAIALTKMLGLPTLFLTHRVNLLAQTGRRYLERCPELKPHIGVLGGGSVEPKRITIATVQTLFGMIKKHPKQMAEFLSQFQFLILDEAHRGGAKQFYIPASLCRNAYYRLALTATPFMGDDEEADMFLMGITGDIFSRVTNGELIEQGILAKPLFKFFTVTEPCLDKYRNWRDVYERGIIFNASRNLLIVKQAKKLTDMGKKILIIVRECAHGELLTSLIEGEGIRVKYCDGRHSAEERETALSAIRKNRIDAIVATNIFDEGIDVKDINAIILAAGTKSAPALFQRTGRAIRAKDEKEGNYAIIIDFIDDTHRILKEHSMRRYEMVKNETGFSIL